MKRVLLTDKAGEHGFAVRQGEDRRKHDRRAHGRSTPDRRRGERRARAATGGVLLAAATLAAPTSLYAKPAVKPLVVSSTSDFSAPPSDFGAPTSDFSGRGIEKAFEIFIQEAADTYRMDAALIRAVMRAESAFDPQVVSSAGAIGLMQLMPALAVEMGVRDPFDPRENTMGGARYLKQLLTRHGGNVALALASYNAGPGAVQRYGNQIPPFKETRNYVKKIIGFLKGRYKSGRSISPRSSSGGRDHTAASSAPISRSTETIDGKALVKYSNVPATPAGKSFLK